MKLVFEIYVPPEPAAGLPGTWDIVNVIVESGEPGGEEGEFAQYILECLEQWYDAGNSVKLLRGPR